MEEDNNPIKEMGTKTAEPSTNTQQANCNQGSSVTSKKVSTPCLLSFIFALVGLIIAGLPCGIVALITGITGLAKFNKDTEKFRWMGIVGIIVGVVDVVAVVLNIILQTMQLVA